MVTLQEIERQLEQIGASFRYWGRAEIRELQHILIAGEQIQGCMNGRYGGGFAVLCATDQRLLLVDKKPMYLTVEDIRYDMVAEVEYGHRLLDATIRIRTPNRTLSFTAYKHKELRAMTMYLQQRVIEIRQQYSFQQAQQQVPVFQQVIPAVSPPQDTPAQPLPPVSPSLAPAAPAALSPVLPALPIPGFTNPYVRTSLRTRRRVSRFS